MYLHKYCYWNKASPCISSWSWLSPFFSYSLLHGEIFTFTFLYPPPTPSFSSFLLSLHCNKWFLHHRALICPFVLQVQQVFVTLVFIWSAFLCDSHRSTQEKRSETLELLGALSEHLQSLALGSPDGTAEFFSPGPYSRKFTQSLFADHENFQDTVLQT